MAVFRSDIVVCVSDKNMYVDHQVGLLDLKLGHQYLIVTLQLKG
jgi:hypothetical protein